MIKVTPTMSTLPRQAITTATKKITKPTIEKTLPAISALGILAGSSMGPGNPIKDVPHTPGSSATDPLIEQVGYFSDKLIDLGETAGEAILNGTHHVIDSALNGFHDLTGVGVDGVQEFADGVFDIGSDIVDGAGDVLHKVVDVVIDVFT